jgi:hypothetical protein
VTGRSAIGRAKKAEEFFDLGGNNPELIAAVKLKPFATRTSFESFLEMGHFKFPN